MSGLAVRNQNGEAVHYTGSQFSGLENTGTRHLCVRTGTGANDVVKYGLTSAPLNDKYKGLRMRIPDNAGGNGGRDAYIAQRYSTSASASSAKTYTASRVSNYVSSTTLRTASSTRLSTKNVTRVSTHAPIYYATSSFTCSLTEKATYYGTVITSSYITRTLTRGMFLTNSSATTIYNTQTSATRVYATASVISSIYGGVTRAIKLEWYGVYSVTRTQTSRASNYVSSQTLSTASSSRLSTGNATRSSAYNTSSSVSTTSSKLTHNANL